MDNTTYRYDALSKKYDGFTAPAYEVTVAGQQLESSRFRIDNLEVELVADGTAGGCSFTVEGMYDYEQGDWADELLSLVTLGAKLTVSAGYVQQREVFYGYVDDFSLEFSGDGTPRLQVTGIDGLGYLMSCREPLYAGERPVREIVTEILKKSVRAGFARDVSVGTIPEFQAPLVKEQVDDWRFLNLLAQRCGATLQAVDGKLIFDTAMGQTREILCLTMGVGLEQLQKRVSLARQVGQVEILGRDVNQKPIRGTADSVSVGGSGRSAAQLVPAYAQTVLREYSELARTEAECQRLAQARLDGIAMELVSGSGQCVGIPELVPGRYLKVDGGGEKLDGLYFLTRVRHLLSGDGYRTAFEFKGAKL